MITRVKEFKISKKKDSFLADNDFEDENDGSSISSHDNNQENFDGIGSDEFDYEDFDLDGKDVDMMENSVLELSNINSSDTNKTDSNRGITTNDNRDYQNMNQLEQSEHFMVFQASGPFEESEVRKWSEARRKAWIGRYTSPDAYYYRFRGIVTIHSMICIRRRKKKRERKRGKV